MEGKAWAWINELRVREYESFYISLIPILPVIKSLFPLSRYLPCYRPNCADVAPNRKRRQLTTLTKLKALLARKKAIENEILATVETMVEACENFGTMIQSDDSTGLDESEN